MTDYTTPAGLARCRLFGERLYTQTQHDQELERLRAQVAAREAERDAALELGLQLAFQVEREKARATELEWARGRIAELERQNRRLATKLGGTQ